MTAKTFPGKPDYTYSSAIIGGMVFSFYLWLNIASIVRILGFGEFLDIVNDNLGVIGFFLLVLLPFVLVYFSCIYKKKYLEILERFNLMDKNLKKRLLSVLIGFLYMGISIFLFVLISNTFK